MTVEERAYRYTSRINGAGDIWTDIIEQMEAALRDQIEECAQILDKEHAAWGRIAKEHTDSRTYRILGISAQEVLKIVNERIRALARPTEEGKESGR